MYLPSQDKLETHETIAFFYLNIAVTDLPGLLEISGLFIKEESEMDAREEVYKCVCPPVSKAIVKYFSDHAKPTIDVLVGHLIIFLYIL